MENRIITVNGDSYEIIKLLAKGKGGYNYLAKINDTPVVVKQIHYEHCDYYRFEKDKLNCELRDYKTLFDIGIPMPRLIDYCQEKQVLIKEYIAGDTLAELVIKNEIETAHILQIFEMCKRLYPNHLNIDYFPTNFMEHQGGLCYVDYECSPYSDEWNFENWGIYFLANREGMIKLLSDGDDSSLIKDGKPIKDGFDDVVVEWINSKESIA
jgi:tRNA A-37 threonylcarbamoyl transferase component Bud32